MTAIFQSENLKLKLKLKLMLVNEK